MPLNEVFDFIFEHYTAVRTPRQKVSRCNTNERREQNAFKVKLFLFQILNFSYSHAFATRFEFVLRVYVKPIFHRGTFDRH